MTQSFSIAIGKKKVRITYDEIELACYVESRKRGITNVVVERRRSDRRTKEGLMKLFEGYKSGFGVHATFPAAVMECLVDIRDILASERKPE